MALSISLAESWQERGGKFGPNPISLKTSDSTRLGWGRNWSCFRVIPRWWPDEIQDASRYDDMRVTYENRVGILANRDEGRNLCIPGKQVAVNFPSTLPLKTAPVAEKKGRIPMFPGTCFFGGGPLGGDS